MASPAVRFALGLVVGKFAPLHFGHEFLIRTAAAQCQRLLILSYTKPEFERCDPAQRREWLRARFPQFDCVVADDDWVRETCEGRGIAALPIPPNESTDEVHQRWLAWLLTEVVGQRPDAIFCSEDYGTATAKTLSQAFGKPVAAVIVDRGRVGVPISASAIRRSPHLARHWTAPEVAASFVRRVALLGGESSGKTTLAEALAKALSTTWVAEYGRELWELQGGCCESDLLKIASEQIAREARAARSAADWLVCDTSPLTTLGYSHWMFGRADPQLVRMAQRQYDAYVLCCPDFPFVQDGTRRDDGFRHKQHAWYVEQLQAGGTPWLAVTGSVVQRVDQLSAWLGDLKDHLRDSDLETRNAP